MSASEERDKVIHDLASMVQVLDLNLTALAQARPADKAGIIAECREATTRLRTLFLRLQALYKAG